MHRGQRRKWHFGQKDTAPLTNSHQIFWTIMSTKAFSRDKISRNSKTKIFPNFLFFENGPNLFKKFSGLVGDQNPRKNKILKSGVDHKLWHAELQIHGCT